MSMWLLLSILDNLCWAIHLVGVWAWLISRWFVKGTHRYAVFMGMANEVRPILREVTVVSVVASAITKFHDGTFGWWNPITYALMVWVAWVAYNNIDDDDRWGRRARKFLSLFRTQPQVITQGG